MRQFCEESVMIVNAGRTVTRGNWVSVEWRCPQIKINTVIKILTRYKKGLAFLEQEALSKKASADAEHYKTDRLALEQAIQMIERSNTES